MITAFIKGAGYPLIGLRWLSKPRLRRYVIIPLLANTILFAVAIWWGIGAFSELMDALMVRLVGWMPDWLSWLADVLYWLLWPLFAIVLLLLLFYTFTLVMNLIAAPFNGLLAEHTEDLADPATQRPLSRPLWQEIAITPAAELRKLGYFLLRALPLLILFVIPVINIVAPFVWMAFSAWMLTLQYADYPLANHRIAFRQQRELLAQRRPLALGFGAAVLVIMLIPVLNFLIMPAAVIGATLMWVEQLRGVHISSISGAGDPPPPPDYPGN